MDKLVAFFAGLQSLAAQVEEVKAAVESEKVAFGLEQYDAGKASVVLPQPGTGELIFTQDDVDKVAATARAEVTAKLQPQIDDLGKQVADIKAQADAAAQAQVVAIAEACKAEKAKWLEKVKAAELDNAALIAEMSAEEAPVEGAPVEGGVTPAQAIKGQ